MVLSELSQVDPTFSLIPLVVFLPVLGLLLNIFFGRYLGQKGVGWLASAASGSAFVVSVLLALALGRHPEGSVLPFASWIRIDELNIGWNFRVDTLSTTMMLVVSGVGTLIHIYAIGYMQRDVRHNGDPGRYRRFFVYLNLFIAAMMLLVTADNYLMLFVGWEGVGLCSYLLIGFWFEKGAEGTANARAAKKAFVVNRIGDFGLLLAIILMFLVFRSLDFETIFFRAPLAAAAMPGVILAITLLMLLGVAGKSAQLPLFVWLPDAMAGPTPVSALIHAATMVTAGVYLVARSHALFDLVPVAQAVVTWVGTLTALFAATIAIGQFDIKKVLAYSTISQLGFMVAAVGMGAYSAGIFHLVTHAFFKALLFLGAGSVILGMEHSTQEQHDEVHHSQQEEETDPQDMRNMGGLRGRMPLTFWVYLAGALALAGIAPLAGFFSKDEILAAASQYSPIILILLILTAFLTAFYMGRQLWLIFFGKARSQSASHAVENPPIITIPLIILALLSIFGGALNLPGIHTLETWLEHTFNRLTPAEFAWPVAGGSLAVALLGLVLAWLAYGRKALPAQAQDPDPLAKILGVFFKGMQRKWLVDEIYNAIIVRPYQAAAQFLTQEVDLEIIDASGNGLGKLTNGLAQLLRRLQNGYVRSYALVMVLGVVLILAYLFLR